MYTIPRGLLSTPMTGELSLIRTVDTDKPVSQRLPSRRPISRVSSDRTRAGLAVPTSHVFGGSPATLSSRVAIFHRRHFP